MFKYRKVPEKNTGIRHTRVEPILERISRAIDLELLFFVVAHQVPDFPAPGARRARVRASGQYLVLGRRCVRC